MVLHDYCTFFETLSKKKLVIPVYLAKELLTGTIYTILCFNIDTWHMLKY